MPTKADRNLLYQQLPQVGEFLDGPLARDLLRQFPRSLVIEALRSVLAKLREDIASGALDEVILRAQIEHIPDSVASELHCRGLRALRPVINATGVILQTNLGRAPLCDDALEQLAAVARGYCNVEFDLEAGERGRRGTYAEELLLRLLQLDSASSGALIVNNCAAAAFLALDSIASDGEVIVSRGELVEIGGGFRVPEILQKSRARLVEVGTTNRTRIDDYAAAITADTRLILRVHRSNFRMVGFTAQPQLRELARLGADAGVPVMIDQGTGCLVPLPDLNHEEDASFRDAVHSGASLVCASGDKLLGGPQCGLVVGESGLIRRLRTNPLYRALRVDKLTLAALEATLHAYLREDLKAIPVMKMLAADPDEIRDRCETWVQSLNTRSTVATVVSAESTLGGGTSPGASIPSFAVALRVAAMTAEQLSAALRALETPIIARIHEDRVLLDLRTVIEDTDTLALRLLSELIESITRLDASAADAPG